MSSPPAAAPSAPANDDPRDVEVDAEMEDITQDADTSQNPSGTGTGTATGAANDRSSTVDNTDTTTTLAADPTQQTQTQSSTLPQQSRKDVTLREFLSKMDDYAPIIPDAVTAHYLTLAGLPPPSAADPSGASTGTTPLPLARLLALATQKFVADIAADAYQYSRIRANNTSAAANALGGAGLPLGPGGVGAGVGVPGVAGVGGTGGAKGGQNAQLGVQRAGFGGGGQGGSGTGKTVLTMEDLGMAVQEYGVNVRRGEFYR